MIRLLLRYHLQSTKKNMERVHTCVGFQKIDNAHPLRGRAIVTTPTLVDRRFKPRQARYFVLFISTTMLSKFMKSRAGTDIL